MGTEVSIVDLLVALGVSGVVGTIVNFIFNRKGMKADAAKVIAEAAGSVVTTMQAQLDEMREELDARKRYDRERELLDAAHEQWDRQVYEAVKRLDPNSPILLPPPLRPQTPLTASGVQ